MGFHKELSILERFEWKYLKNDSLTIYLLFLQNVLIRYCELFHSGRVELFAKVLLFIFLESNMVNIRP